MPHPPQPTSPSKSTPTRAAAPGAPGPDPDPLDADGLLARSLLDEAQRRVGAALAPTPAVRSEARGAWLKLENLQPTGAYKVRGAFNALAAQIERGDRRPVVAASAGNHGLGVAWAARHLGLPATVVVPASAPSNKARGCAALGAEVAIGGADFESCVATAQALARARGARFLHAFDDPEVIAGQATVAAELLPLCPDVVVVPIGGGGLASGVGSLLRRAGVRVVGVQVAGVDSLRRALAAAGGGDGRDGAGADEAAGGARGGAPTLADGLRVAAPGALTRRICAALFAPGDLIVVEEAEIAATMAALALREKVIAEGAGAAAVAALDRLPARAAGARRFAVVSGGNVDAGVLARLLAPPATPAHTGAALS
jgi:threonine dehydratase